MHTTATLAKAGDALVVKPVKVTDVWVAFKTHFDIGYTDTIESVLTKYRVNMMESALKIIEPGPQLPPEKRFAWMIPGWPLKHILGPQQDPARKTRIEQAVREGALGVGAIAVQPAHRNRRLGRLGARARLLLADLPRSTAGRCPSRRR